MKSFIDQKSIDFTTAIQVEIDKCSSNGGGLVVIPEGTHYCGSIVLKSNVELHLLQGAVLKGSPDFEDYPSLPGGFKDAVGHLRSRCLIYAKDAEHIAISGEGEIDGNGGVFDESHPEHLKRPFLLRFIECNNITIADITLKNSAAWVCHLQKSKGISIANIRIHSHCNHNNDGIDIDSCSNVEIRNCDIDTGDDALCFKTTSSMPCENINVENCRLKSNCGALKFGTESYADFRNIKVNNCEIRDTLLGAIKFCAMDGGSMQDISISDITIKNSTGPFFVRLGDRRNVYMEETPKKPGVVSNIRLEKITADIMDMGKEHSGVLMTGIPGHQIENIMMKDIDITFPGGGTFQDSLNRPEEQVGNYPEASYFGVLPAYAFYIRHARNINLSNIRVRTKEPDHRKALIAEDLENSLVNITEDAELLSVFDAVIE